MNPTRASAPKISTLAGGVALLSLPLLSVGLAPAQEEPTLASRNHFRSLRALFPTEFRSIDGTGNNGCNPLWGATEEPLARLAPVAYADGVSAPSGADRPSARAISNAVADQDETLTNTYGVSDYLWQWGQFLDHDIDETPVGDPPEEFQVVVPIGDIDFDPAETGTITIPLTRSFREPVDGGWEEQINLITAYIDASNVYGSDPLRAMTLRTLDGTGRLRTSEGDLLPYNTSALPNAPSDSPNFFLAGDIRANEQAGLTAMHTLFVREHNFWANVLREQLGRHYSYPGDNRRGRGHHGTSRVIPVGLGDEALYQIARAIVAAEMQVITYNEFLPVLLGPDAIPPYSGYDDTTDATIANEFATAAYRVGHTMLSSQIMRLDAQGNEVPAGHLDLAEAFFDPTHIETEGIDSLLRGLAAQPCQEIDNHVVDDVRNFLFGAPGQGGFDLASLNMQRGRDHGLPSHTEMREALGLSPVTDWADITSDTETQAQLASVYATPQDVDLWVGGLCEDHVPGAMVGETFREILIRQFTALRDGDRFWYENYLSRPLQRLVESQTLSTIIRRNTGIGHELQDDVFTAAFDSPAD